MNEIQSQLPEFERAKKSAVTERNFAEAKRLNELIKQLKSEIETIVEDVELMKNTLIEDKEKTGLLKEEHAITKNDVIEAKENYGMNLVFNQTIYCTNASSKHIKWHCAP